MVYFEWYVVFDKWHCRLTCINLGDAEFLDVWDDAYTAVMRYSRAWDGFWVSISF